jgi:uncharacterized SAM-binding protein YcdF (DUF218 family)
LPPVDDRGYPIFEAIPAAQYLHSLGVPRRQILAETSSYDTIGNAFFARLMHVDPRGLRRLLIVNSEFHMARTQAVFRWVFGAAPDPGYDLTFESTGNGGLSEEGLAARMERERASLEDVRALANRIVSLSDLHLWIYTEHRAYAWFLHGAAYRPIGGPLSESYGGVGS